MNATLQAHSLRSFKRILQCIAKFGEELQIQATHTELSLSAVNSSKSAFCLFLLDAEKFFHRYELTGAAAEGGGGVKCKLLVKSVMSVLGRGNHPQSVDTLQLQIVDAEGVAPTRKKKVQSRRRGGQRGRQEMEDEEEDELDEGRHSIQAKLVLVLNCKHGVVKKHSLNLSPCECLIAEVDHNACPNNFVVPARTLKDWIEHFSVSGGAATITTSSSGAHGQAGTSIKYENELGWYFSQNEIRVKTLEANRPPAMRQYLSTEIKIAPDEFDEYAIEQGPVQLAFPLREFRAAFQLAEFWSIPLEVRFGHALDPMLVKVDIEGVRGEFIMATIESDVFPPEQLNGKQPGKVKNEPKPISASHSRKEQNRPMSGNIAKLENAPKQVPTSNKRKRTSLSLIEGQNQEVTGLNPANGLLGAEGDQQHNHEVGPDIVGSLMSRNGSENVQDPEFLFDPDFQPNGTLNPLQPDMHNDEDPQPPQERQQPLFLSTQDEDDDEDKMHQRQSLLQQSQAEVDGLNPEELEQMMADDHDITMDGVEESYLGPTQPMAEEEVIQGSGNRRSYHALFDD